VLLEELAQFGAASVDLVAGRPVHRDAGRQRASGLFQGDGGLGAEDEVPSQTGPFTALGVFGPVLLDVEVAVDQAVAQRAGVGAVHRDHRIADLPGGAGVLASDPGRGGALLLLTRLVEDQHRSRRGQVAHGESAHRVAGGVLVPDGLIEQPLHPVLALLPGHEPTEAQFAALCAASGLRLASVINLGAVPVSIVEVVAA